MKRFIWMFAILALITSCKTQHVAPIILKDSVSVTYRPGIIQSLTDSTDFTDSAPTCGGAITVKPQHDGLTSQAQRCPSARPLQIPQKVRVDTLIVERWHTQTIREPTTLPYEGKAGKGSFYKNCTLGFWVLLILLLGSFGFRIMKAIYLRK